MHYTDFDERKINLSRPVYWWQTMTGSTRQHVFEIARPCPLIITPLGHTEGDLQLDPDLTQWLGTNAFCQHNLSWGFGFLGGFVITFTDDRLATAFKMRWC